MPESSTNETIIQPNPYAGGQPAPPISMPGQGSQTASGGSSSSNSQSSGQNTIIIDDEVSFSGPSTSLNGTPQQSGPSSGGNAQTTTSGTDFNSAVVGMTSGANGAGQNQSSGWRQNGNNWYYFDPATGNQVFGWKKIDGYWYYLTPGSGIMATGWVEIKDELMKDGLWYYLEPSDGHMLTGWQYIDNEWYYLETTNGNGQMVTGWKSDNGKWYYLFETGVMAHGGWILVDEKWYCVRENSGELEISKILEYNGKKYYVNENGAMITREDQETVEYEDIIYDVAEDGVCTPDESIQNKLNAFVQIALDEHISITGFRENQLKKKDKNGDTYYEGDNKTKYGSWYGLDGEPWCAMFVSWCANQANILGDIVPKYASCLEEGKPWYVRKGKHHGQSSGYKPKKGDVFFQTRTGGGHTGIVVAYDIENKISLYN